MKTIPYTDKQGRSLLAVAVTKHPETGAITYARVLAVDPKGHLVEVDANVALPDGNWRYASKGDVDAKVKTALEALEKEGGK
jgi:hypothetical protein